MFPRTGKSETLIFGIPWTASFPNTINSFQTEKYASERAGERRDYPIRKDLEMMNEDENGTVRKRISKERLHVPKAGCS